MFRVFHVYIFPVARTFGFLLDLCLSLITLCQHLGYNVLQLHLARQMQRRPPIHQTRRHPRSGVD